MPIFRQHSAAGEKLQNLAAGRVYGMSQGSKAITPGNLALECHGFGFQVQAPYDSNTGGATGKRRHSQLSITKEVDAASPLLLAVLGNNRVLQTLKLKFVKTNPQGMARPYFTITLTDAALAGYGRKPLPHSASPRKGPSVHELEQVAFTFQKIDVNFDSGAAAASDDWTK